MLWTDIASLFPIIPIFSDVVAFKPIFFIGTYNIADKLLRIFSLCGLILGFSQIIVVSML